MPNPATLFALCIVVATQTVGAFAPSSADTCTASSVSPTSRLMAKEQPSDRRAFVGGIIHVASILGVTAITGAPSSPAWADEEEKVEDLAMPTAEEQKALDGPSVLIDCSYRYYRSSTKTAYCEVIV
eukprot:CAMPEP_0178718796 /NCGR_PEP_ID=MMETSP0699-20121125/22739_1 /TAXON_ID=265572 /ORGANISM="Extubocellulus spinifer, Strain CCMP396" /LENGTH=126 /DNA_ID=CAMNT_0020368903 /DNA_START=303 /DNA_END=683 /DNA_ORIENTATION=-